MSDMSSSFKSKTQKFVNDIQTDFRKSKPILKQPSTCENKNNIQNGDDARTYREESRLAQYGKIHTPFITANTDF